MITKYVRDLLNQDVNVPGHSHGLSGAFGGDTPIERQLVHSLAIFFCFSVQFGPPKSERASIFILHAPMWHVCNPARTLAHPCNCEGTATHGMYPLKTLSSFFLATKGHHQV